VIGLSQRPLAIQHTQKKEKNIHALSGILTRDPSNQTVADLRLRLHGQLDWRSNCFKGSIMGKVIGL
jgi:hypothetical protein